MKGVAEVGSGGVVGGCVGGAVGTGCGKRECEICVIIACIAVTCFPACLILERVDKKRDDFTERVLRKLENTDGPNTPACVPAFESARNNLTPLHPNSPRPPPDPWAKKKKKKEREKKEV